MPNMRVEHLNMPKQSDGSNRNRPLEQCQFVLMLSGNESESRQRLKYQSATVVVGLGRSLRMGAGPELESTIKDGRREGKKEGLEEKRIEFHAIYEKQSRPNALRQEDPTPSSRSQKSTHQTVGTSYSVKHHSVSCLLHRSHLLQDLYVTWSYTHGQWRQENRRWSPYLDSGP